MVGSGSAESRRAAVLERDEILATKITIPRIRPGCLQRSRLLAALDEAILRELTLVCTPAGFGKTTLLSDWAQNADLAVAWLSLDEDDNDPTRFWRYVLAALDRVIDVDDSVRTLVANPGRASSEGLARAFIHEVENLSEDLAVVLDDYHTVETQEIHDEMSFLLDHQPSHLRVIVSSRTDPPLPVARMRASNQLAELRASDLRLTEEESEAFLRKVWELDVTPQTTAALQARTEGWVVGLQLAALSLKDRSDREAFVEAFTGTHRYVLDYLSEEVLEAQPEPVREFLLQTSILERLSGPLCDAVTGGTKGQDMLEEFERANLFVIPLDEERRWYRFHRLFSDLLCARLEQTNPESLPELHRRAGAWYADHGLVDDAIRHALAAGEAEWAATLVDGQLEETLRRGEGVILDRWLSALPNEAVWSRPRLCLAQSEMRLHLGHLESAERLAKRAEQAFDKAAEPREQMPTAGGVVAGVPAAIALLRAELAAARGDAEGTASHARWALAKMTDAEHGPRLGARFLLASADWMGGRMEDAELGFGEVLVEGRATPESYPLMSSCFKLGRIQRVRGKLSDALQTYREGLRFAHERGHISTFHAGEAQLGIAQVLYQRNQLGDALRHVTESIELCRKVVEFQLPAWGRVCLAWIRQATGDAEGALKAMEEACAIRPVPDMIALWNPAPSERARLLLAQGRVEEASRWTEEVGLNENDILSYAREAEYLVLARILLARSHPDRALPILEQLDALARSQGREESLIQIHALRSLALQAAGDQPAARTLLVRTLSLAHPQGYVRVFADEGTPMAGLLRALSGSGQDRGPRMSRPVTAFRNRILRAFEPVDRATDEETGATHLPDLLTEREVEVLRLVAAGRRNREIAEELWVAVDTVKKHISHILDKLAATNRTEAVAEAMNLGILDRAD